MAVKLELFTSQSCPYCPMAVEVVDEAKKELGDDLDVEKLDVAVNPGKVQEYDLMSVPTIVINGSIAFTGAPDVDELVAKVKSEM